MQQEGVVDEKSVKDRFAFCWSFEGHIPPHLSFLSLIRLKSAFHSEWRRCCFTVSSVGVCTERAWSVWERRDAMFMKVGRQTRKLISLLFHNYSFEKDIVNHIGSRRQKEKQLIFRFILQNTFLIPIALFIPPLSEHFVLVPLSLRPLPEKPSVLWLVSAHRPEQAQPHCISTSTLSVSLQPQDCARSIAERSDCIFVT